MLLTISDGTTTIDLSGTAPVRGCTYYPLTPSTKADELQDVTETAEVNLSGTEAAIRATINAVERLLTAARGRSNGEGGVPRIYANYKPVDADAATYRSEIVDGRVEWSSNPGLRRIGDTEPFIRVAVIWTRRPFWEVPAEAAAGTVHITNGDMAGGAAIGQWVGPAAPPTLSAAFAADEGDNAYNAGEWTNIVGVLPTPVHLRITNESGSTMSVRRVFVGNDVYARFDGAQHQLGSGTPVSWSGSSTHATPRWTLALTDAQVAKLVAAGGTRLLAVMTSIDAGVYLRAQLQQVAGAGALPAWTGPEAWTETGKFVYDLGYVQMPPGVATFTGWQVVVTVFDANAGAGQLDFLQLCPGRDLVVLDGPSGGVDLANGATIDWWGDERYAAAGGLHASLRGVGQLLLQPLRPNRLMVLVEGTSGVSVTKKLVMQVKYRPRRPTL